MGIVACLDSPVDPLVVAERWSSKTDSDGIQAVV